MKGALSRVFSPYGSPKATALEDVGLDMVLTTNGSRWLRPLKYSSRRRWRSIATLCGALGFSLLFTNEAEASFTAPYALSNFMLNNSSVCALDVPNGTATTPDNGLTVVLTGSNSGSGCAGTTDLTATALAAGVVQFNYLYTSLDNPGLDFAGYLVGGSFTPLADTSGMSGSVMVPVALGQMFGFRVGTVDNTFEPGILTISGFSAPGAPITGGDVPEPGTLSLVSLSLGAILAKRMVKA